MQIVNVPINTIYLLKNESKNKMASYKISPKAQGHQIKTFFISNEF